MNANKNGFTLIEMSIVLVIIGLIIGGIVIGQSMIRDAELQNVIKEEQQYTQAIQDFRDKYNALPGDMATATTFWGDEGDCGSPTYTTTPHTATCNGNGDGHIGNPISDNNTDYEMYRAWQQLADAGLIAGAYNGIAGTGAPDQSLIGINVPASKLPNAGYTVDYTYPVGHIFIFGTAVPANPWQNTNMPIITPAEAWNIDAKMDDGWPGSGNVFAGYQTFAPNCVTSDTPIQYNLRDSATDCYLMFNLGF